MWSLPGYEDFLMILDVSSLSRAVLTGFKNLNSYWAAPGSLSVNRTSVTFPVCFWLCASSSSVTPERPAFQKHLNAGKLTANLTSWAYSVLISTADHSERRCSGNGKDLTCAPDARPDAALESGRGLFTVWVGASQNRSQRRNLYSLMLKQTE